VDTTVLGLYAERAKDMPYIASMGIYVVSKEAMISLLRNDFPEANDFGSEVIPGATKLGMNVRTRSQAFYSLMCTVQCGSSIHAE
jgi:glucose-1-phosphate adenylyltransferase